MYQVQSRVEINTLFYSVLFWLFISFCYIVADFKLLRLETLCTKNVDQIVGIHKNNVDHKGLRICQVFSVSCTIVCQWVNKLLFH